ncbi:MAG: GTP-binding protein [Enterocloster clostridioformis]
MHPDSTYRGAKAILALTGYNGILGCQYSGLCEKTDTGAERGRSKSSLPHSWGHRDRGSRQKGVYMTDVYVISGFLGAGKTTLIKTMVRSALRNKKIVVIENDFGAGWD